jgi:hypothetical protein
MTEQLLGKITLEVFVNDNDELRVSHDTELSDALQTMALGMGETERKTANNLRWAVSHAATRFFMYVRDPDQKLTIAPTSHPIELATPDD